MSSLRELAEAEELTELEDAWLEHLQDSPDPADMTAALATLRAAGTEEAEELAAGLLTLSLDELEASESPALPELLEGAARLFDRGERLRSLLLDHLRDEYLSYEPLEQMIERSGLERGGSIRTGWKRLRKLLRYRKGSFVLHSRFGPGELLRIRRTSATVDFRKASDHDMSLDALLDTTEPVSEDSLEVLHWKRPRELRGLLESDHGELLRRLLEEHGGEVSEGDLTPLLEGSGTRPRTLWKHLRRIAASSGELMDLGDSIARISGGSLPSVMRRTLADRRQPLAERVKKLAALLDSDADGRLEPEEAAGLAELAAGLDTPETGARFEAAWLLSRRAGREMLPGVETSAARALRALGEIASGACAKEYVARTAAKVSEEGAMELLEQLGSRRREWLLAELVSGRPSLAAAVLRRMCADISRPDMYIWAVRQALERGLSEEAGLSVGADLASALLEALGYARASEQRRACRLLGEGLGDAFEEHLEGLDTRRLSSLAQKLEASSAAHESGLLLQVRRELSNRRRTSASGQRRFWEGEHMFASTAAIEKRRKEAERLEREDIPAAAEAVGEAASHGDLSENAEYEAAIERRDMLLARLRDYKEELRRARPYPVSDVTDRICSPGTAVLLASAEGDTARYEIVGPLDSEPEAGRISYLSPLGEALLGRRRGDTVSMPGVKGSMTVESIEVLPEVRGE